MKLEIELSDVEAKALAFVAASPQEWAENMVRERCRVAIEEIYLAEVQRMTADPEIDTIPADRNAVVLAANVKTGAERNAEVIAEIIGDVQYGV